MTLRQEIERWLASPPDATPQEAIWAGAEIECRLWCNNTRR
nr:MAG TPA: hypothetical protein [Caudoviricetes sp.]